MIVEDRSQLAAFLESRLIGSGPAEGRDRSAARSEATPIKSYLVEARGRYGGSGGDPRRLLGRVLSERRLQRQFAGEAYESQLPDLLTIRGPMRGQEAESFHVDCRDERLWVIHTAARSHTADWVVGRMARVGSGVTRITFPEQLLEMAIGLGELRSAALAHDRRPFAEDPEQEEGRGFMSMQIWGDRSSHALSALRAERRLEECISLSRVQIRYQPDPADPEAFILDDIDREGRLEARGSSVAAHFHLVETLRRACRMQIDAIEARHAMRARRMAGRIPGELLTVQMARPIDDPGRLCKTLLSGSAPFRLWVASISEFSSVAQVRALDLDTTGVLDLGIGRDFIRIGLPQATSGGVVLRFYANVQRHLDAQARLLDAEGRDVIDIHR